MRGLTPLCFVLGVALAVSSCATGARAQGNAAASTPPIEPPPVTAPDGTESQAPPVSGVEASSGAEADFQLATTKHLSGDLAGAKALALELRGQPAVRERANALLALVFLEQGDPAQARRTLTPGPAAASATNFLAAVADARLGQAAAAWPTLAPLLRAEAPLVPGLTADVATAMLFVAGAESAAGTGHVSDALQAWQRYADTGRPAEKAFALRRAEAGVAALSEKDALVLYQNSRSNLSRVVLASKAAVALAGSGQAEAARKATEEAASLRREFDNTATTGAAVWAGTGDPGRLGLSIPLSGKGQPLGLAITRGAVVAIGTPSSNKDVGPAQVMVRDTAGRGGPLTAATELAREEAVLGVVGLADAATIEQMSRDGVPYLVMGGANPGAQTTSFQLVHGSEARIRALADLAQARGIRSFAMLAPDNDSGRRACETFRQAVAATRGQVVAEAKYPPNATAFTKEVEALKKQRWEALFVPDSADKLELIGPALAVADLWAQPTASVVAAAKEKPKRGASKRNILMLSTAAGVSKKTLDHAGRYLQGALLAPGYHPDPDQPSAARFVNEFRGLYGRDPGASDAYGFDGVHLLRACVERGARSRADVLRILASGVEFPGVTGSLRFGPDHGRMDRALIYEVSDDRIRAQP
ncbi:MAG: penicillin-binding protein activator [Deltaproteobacteria bacterium]|nr:penicillin-binding protein activator [Deltaproteobacteria bacterium]